MGTTFESLPNEVQQLVFELLDGEKITLSQCLLVCKSWHYLFQKVLYTYVELSNYYPCAVRLSKILGTAPHLGKLIKKLRIGFDITHMNSSRRSTMTKLFTRMPNLESIDCESGDYFSLLLDAILMGHLPKLNYIAAEVNSDQMRDYITCTFLLKDRLRNLCVIEADRNPESTSYYSSESSSENSEDETDDDVTTSKSDKNTKGFNRLFSKLNQFKNIQKLCIKKRPENIVELIETVTQNCPSLEHLEIEFISKNINQQDSSTIDFNNSILSTSVPAINLKSLILDQNACSNNFQLKHYLMHKFPRLEYLDIYGTTNYDNDEITFNKLLTFLSKIKEISAPNISCRGQTLINSIDLFCKITDPSYKLIVGIYLHNMPHVKPDVKMISIETEPRSKTINTIPLDAAVDFIKKYGKYIVDLSVRYTRFTSPNPLDDANNMPYTAIQPLKDCIRLKKLAITNCVLSELNISGYEAYKRETFDRLEITDCDLENDVVFKKLSGVFARIDYLYLSELDYMDEDFNSGSLPLEHINMEYTDIGVLLLSKQRYFIENVTEEESVVLVRLSIQEKEVYYMYDFDSMDDLEFKPIDEEQFRSESDQEWRFIFGVSFRSLGTLNVKHRNEIIQIIIC